MKNAFFMVVDDRYLDIAVAQALNIVKISGLDVHIFIESDNQIDTGAFGSVPENIKFHFNALCSRLPTDLPHSQKWPTIVYLRIFAPGFLSSYDRLIYIDADVHVRRVDDIIFEIDLPYGLAAVHDYGVLDTKAPQQEISKREWLNNIGVDSDRYFNSGVLVIDVKQWRELDFPELLKDYFSKYGEFVRMFDQDFLNHVFQDRWVEISPIWNFQCPLFYLGFEATFDPAFLHFCDSSKPWHFNHSIYHSSYRDIYVRLLADADMDTSKPVFFRKTKKKQYGFKHLTRRIRTRLGFQTKRERRQRQARTAIENQATVFLDNALKQGLFADMTIKQLTTKPPVVIFDGDNLVAEAPFRD